MRHHRFRDGPAGADALSTLRLPFLGPELAIGRIVRLGVSGNHESGWLSSAISEFLRQRLEASDARRLKQLRSGADLDEQGLPFGTIPAAFIDGRDEARLAFPHAQEVFRRVDRGAGSMLATVLSFDNPPEARAVAGYLAPAASTAVLAWYSGELRTRGWEQRPASRPLGERSGAVEVFHRGSREWLTVTVPSRREAQSILGRAGFGRSLSQGETVYVLDYRIGVEQRRTRSGA